MRRARVSVTERAKAGLANSATKAKVAIYRDCTVFIAGFLSFPEYNISRARARANAHERQ